MTATSKRTLCIAIVIVAAAAIAAAQAPTVMTYQGRLLANDGSDTPIDGTVAVDFALFESGGTVPLWSESWPSVTVTDGVFSVLLGSNGSPLAASLFSASTTLFLELTIAGETATPRQQLGSAPFAMIDEPGNEIQDLELSGNSLSLTDDATTVDLSAYLDNTDAQDLTLAGDTLSLSGDASPVDLSDYRDAKTGVGMRYCIATEGFYPSMPKEGEPAKGTGTYVGEITLYPYSFCPSGYVECNGQLLLILSHPALFSLVGTAFGGDGATDFAVPDLGNRVPLGNGSGVVVGGVY